MLESLDLQDSIHKQPCPLHQTHHHHHHHQQQQASAEEPSSSTSSSTDSGASSSSGGPSFGGFAGSFKSNFDSFKSKVGAGSGSGSGGEGAKQEKLGAKASRLLSVAVKEFKDAVLPRDDAVSLTKAYTGPVYQVGWAGGVGGWSVVWSVPTLWF